MNYRWSPLNIFLLVCTVLLLLSPLFTNSSLGGIFLLLSLSPLFILTLIIDCVLQIFISSRQRIVLIELVAIVIILMLALTLMT